MKKLVAFLCCSLFFVMSCGPTPEQLAATATWQVYDNQVATIIAGTKTARAALPTATRTPTPVPISLLADALLTRNEVDTIMQWEKELQNEDFINADKYNFYHELPQCLYNCFGRIWANGNLDSQLAILLSRYPTAKEAERIYEAVYSGNSKAGTPKDYPSLNTLVIPEDAVIFDDASLLLFARQGRVIFQIYLDLPEQSKEQQFLLLGLYAEKQLIKLIEFGN